MEDLERAAELLEARERDIQSKNIVLEEQNASLNRAISQKSDELEQLLEENNYMKRVIKEDMVPLTDYLRCMNDM